MKIATCQFPISANIGRNASTIEQQLVEAAGQRAKVVHFPECALSGYAGVDFEDWGGQDWSGRNRNGFDWDLLQEASRRIIGLWKKQRISVLLGSTHRLRRNLPHNSVYVINPSGKIVDRYDKRFCTGKDLKLYSPGNHPCRFKIGKFRCAVAICHDVRYPELFRDHKRAGVDIVFHSFYNARTKGQTDHSAIMLPTVQAHCGSNYMWSSVANACGYYQSWPSAFVLPDGSIAGRLRQHRRGILISDVTRKSDFRDASEFRVEAMQGALHSGRSVSEPRSRNRTEL